MGKAYNAILRGNHIEWETDSPPVNTDAGIKVQVMIAEQSKSENRGEHLMDIMERLAQTSKTPWPEDAAAWQREIRKDRPLPGRKE
jgi:hypothetical protein